MPEEGGSLDISNPEDFSESYVSAAPTFRGHAQGVGSSNVQKKAVSQNVLRLTDLSDGSLRNGFQLTSDMAVGACGDDNGNGLDESRENNFPRGEKNDSPVNVKSWFNIKNQTDEEVQKGETNTENLGKSDIFRDEGEEMKFDQERRDQSDGPS
ncbi:uncharacterized protein LOC143222411 [Tachypleus tridentatus]|uniref:uncharacterized protein LOC143222411 n=1 Tax=Tachypleus tridentatus TaxID=6853 RepID=UPI003FD0E3ED